MIIDPLFAKQQAYRKLRSILYQWHIPHVGIRNDTFHYVLQVGRFHLYPYWRPMTRDRFERMTLDYLGPHIPIFWSEREYLEDDFIVGEFFDQKYTHHHYEIVHPYFYCPAFVVLREWPHERQWRWTPAIRSTPKTIKTALIREVIYGGWSKNSRGRTRVPQRTGTTGLHRVVENGAGWATYRPEGAAGIHTDGEREGDLYLQSDLSVSRRGRSPAHSASPGQTSLFGANDQENPV